MIQMDVGMCPGGLLKHIEQDIEDVEIEINRDGDELHRIYFSHKHACVSLFINHLDSCDTF